jgi:hypothetical protein
MTAGGHVCRSSRRTTRIDLGSGLRGFEDSLSGEANPSARTSRRCFGTKTPAEHAADFARVIASTQGLTVQSVSCSPRGEVAWTCKVAWTCTGRLQSGRGFTCSVGPVDQTGTCTAQRAGHDPATLAGWLIPDPRQRPLPLHKRPRAAVRLEDRRPTTETKACPGRLLFRGSIAALLAITAQTPPG